MTPEEIEAIVLDELTKCEDEATRKAARERIDDRDDDGDLYRAARERRGY